MNRFVLWTLLLVFFLVGGILFFEFAREISGRAILDDYVYTRAICNNESCKDYEVLCDGNEFVGVRDINGNGVWTNESWIDFREENLCG